MFPILKGFALALLLCSGAGVHAAPDPTVEEIQQRLAERGFDPGRIDGTVGWRTRGALRRFQRSVGLPDTGRIDDATRKALGLKPLAAARPAPEADRKRPEAQESLDESAPQAGTDIPKVTVQRAESVPETDAGTPKVEAARAESTQAVEAARAESTQAVEAARAGSTQAVEAARAGSTQAVEAARAGSTQAVEAARAESTQAVEAARAGSTRAVEVARAEPIQAVEVARAGSTRAPAPEPESAAIRRLSFATLGWHPPQTGAQALTRFEASDGTSPEIQHGEGTLVVPKPDLVFVLKADERIPGLDCDPGAGRLSIEFIFGPDGPIIFTPLAGSSYCQMGFGIALEIGRTLEMQRADWGDTRYPRGTVRISNRGLERAN